jgi:hypothetical protein
MVLIFRSWEPPNQQKTGRVSVGRSNWVDPENIFRSLLDSMISLSAMIDPLLEMIKALFYSPVKLILPLQTKNLTSKYCAIF